MQGIGQSALPPAIEPLRPRKIAMAAADRIIKLA
jgi:hypothetical protein